MSAVKVAATGLTSSSSESDIRPTALGRRPVIGYARVSSREQSENSHALEQQIERLRAAGATEVYSDTESGWKDGSRHGLKKVLELVQSHSCDEVIITRLDRLSRKGVTSFAIFEDFLQLGVTLRALDEPFDLTGLRQKLSPNVTQTGFIGSKQVTI